jgi:thymidine kinase
VVGVDEANFMGPELVDIAQRLADSGKQVIIGGLDTDYMGRPFAPIPDLLAHAESITKTLAICVAAAIRRSTRSACWVRTT